MTDYVEVDEARVMHGLRVVVQPGVPGPWSARCRHCDLAVNQLP